ncbi:MAG TPA: 2-succinyl-6-hydroxy-2,4-cyclohexadiene-1-carboxylate synthase [Solirubrobacteraceae bacterium]|nr:2-succinyl-6-hydroxy-2,4-cyclohexadiene-1-carboxylate synthase [Solirubrobacteraceae bacterium]
MARDVVLLHGFTHTGASWDPVVAALGESYRALALDIPGHGSASDRSPVTLEGVVEDLNTLAPKQFTLVGYSMGGRIALHAALALPGRIERLILIGASPGIADAAEREARLDDDERLAVKIEGMSIEEFARQWGHTPVLAGQPPDVLAAAHADRLRNRPAGLARALRGLGTAALPSLWGRLGEIRVPVALVVGERDEKFREVAARMAPEVPDSELIVVPDAGHAVHLEAPDAVAAAIAAV